ncbi:Proteoglycan 4 [Bagarius yarrelli]|uniref:Proteoglycan 4 n=1 Tax=Bagarius yarrelli TaxID=175774 RepID=A0A556U5W8_BAGYA|nr:Proteoglycan 4 [Bagarius yarrelli]
MAGWICFLLLTACILQQLSATQTSCQGRCGELFSRGQTCTCDDDCLTHNECCKDYEKVCTTICADGGFRSTPPRGQHAPDVNGDGSSVVALVPLTEAASPPADADLYLPLPPKNSMGSTPGTPHAGMSSPGEPLTDGTGHIQISVSVNSQAGGAPNQASDVFEALTGRSSPLTDMVEALEAAGTAELPSPSPSPDLCSDLPINGLASAFNGSIIVFKGDFFWLLDPKTRAAGPAQSITEELGIPSPIDTAFTRCNCEGKTYIIKGDNYWSFQNGVKEPGYPRSVSKDFAGISGNIDAALSVPATRNKPETLYFFRKGGGTVQKLTYPAGPTCTGKKGKNPVPAKNPQPVRRSGEINISLKWKGFPTPVTSALSMPNPKKSDGFDYFIFSGPKVFNIKISGDIPVLASPSKPPAENEVKNWLNCP